MERKEARDLAKAVSGDPSIKVLMGAITAFNLTTKKATATVEGVSLANIDFMDHVDPMVGANAWIIATGKGRWLMIGTTVGHDQRNGTHLTCNQAIGPAAGNPYLLSWDDQVEDTDGYWSSGATITIPTGKGGLYHGTLQVISSISQILILEIWNSIYGGYRGGAGGFLSTRHGFTQTLPLSAGDTVQTSVYNNSSGSPTLTCRLFLYRIGP